MEILFFMFLAFGYLFLACALVLVFSYFLKAIFLKTRHKNKAQILCIKHSLFLKKGQAALLDSKKCVICKSIPKND